METSELRQTTTQVMGPQLARLKSQAGALFGVGLLCCGLSLVSGGPDALPHFFPSYLFAYVFWFGITAGSLGLLMLHHTVGGGWGYVLRRFFEAGSHWRMFALMAVLFVPVLIGLFQFDLYSWVSPDRWAAPDAPRHVAVEVVKEKTGYLNVPFFLGRLAFYFAFFIGFSLLLRRWGAVQDERVDQQAAGNLNRWSAGGILLFVLVGTFCSVDWVMSLTPDWFSSIYGLLWVASQALSTIALMLALLAWLAGDTPLVRGIPTAFFRDLGNLMLAMVMLWAYLSFSQYLIIFSGNTWEEATWYVNRKTPVWAVTGGILILAHFFIPFFTLLVNSDLKKSPHRLGALAGGIVLMRFVDLFWHVIPTFRPEGPRIAEAALYVGTPLLLGGVWLWMFAEQLKDRPVVPVHDPRLQSHLPELAHG